MNRDKDSWKGVWSLTLGISALMMASFLPSGLLTPMAATLNVSEGLVGQTVTVTSIFGLFASLSNSLLAASSACSLAYSCWKLPELEKLRKTEGWYPLEKVFGMGDNKLLEVKRLGKKCGQYKN